MKQRYIPHVRLRAAEESIRQVQRRRPRSWRGRRREALGRAAQEGREGQAERGLTLRPLNLWSLQCSESQLGDRGSKFTFRHLALQVSAELPAFDVFVLQP